MNPISGTVQGVKKVLVQIETSRAYGRSLLAGITKYSKQCATWAICHEEPFLSERIVDPLKHLLDWKPDGIITRSVDHLELLKQLCIPIVIAIHLENPVESIPVVKGDNEAMGRLAGEYLLSLGFHEFGFCGFQNVFWSQERGSAFERVIHQSGYPLHRFPGANETYCNESDQQLLSNWLQSLPKPIAVMVCNDDRGRQLIETAKVQGLRIPDDLAVLGIDNDEVVCDLCTPSLSSIKLDNQHAGYKAAQLLDDLMEGKCPDIQEIVVRPICVAARQSTDIYCVDDKEVSEALCYIRDNSRKMIQVADVAERVCLSKRSLQLRFKNTLGYSVHERIKKEKINRMAELLIDTDMSIIEIALSLGFQNINHVSRFFKEEKGLTPFAFRKRYKMP